MTNPNKKNINSAGKLSFEEAFERLSTVVQTLENGGLSLSASTALFEEGAMLAKTCSHHLKQTELRITNLAEEFTDYIEMKDPDIYDDEN